MVPKPFQKQKTRDTQATLLQVAKIFW